MLPKQTHFTLTHYSLCGLVWSWFRENIAPVLTVSVCAKKNKRSLFKCQYK